MVAILNQTGKTIVKSGTKLKHSHPSSSHLPLDVSFPGEEISCKEMREGTFSFAALPSGGGSLILFPQSS